MQVFFIQAKDILRVQESSAQKSDGSSDAVLLNALNEAKKQTYDYLCDSFNTREVMKSISELTTSFFTLDRTKLSTVAVRDTANWVTSMVNTFGLNGNESFESDIIGWSGLSIPDEAVPYVYTVSGIRDELRRKARALGGLNAEDLKQIVASNETLSDKASNDQSKYAELTTKIIKEINTVSTSDNVSRDILSLCDRIRDADFFDVGIYLEDRKGDEPALVRPVTKQLLDARQEQEEEQRRKQKTRDEEAQKAAARAEKGKQSHLDMFRTSEYSEWDVDGLPIKDAKGEDVAKSKTKKLKKDWERQKKAHEAWLKI